jgi:DNA end-binding protein Ku
VRVRDGLLSLTTMRFPDEIRSAQDIDSGGRKPARPALDAAVALVEALSVDWDPGAYEDRYRERLRAIVKDKEKGATIEAPEEEEEPAPVGDLMEALRKTMAEMGGAGR